MSIQRTARRRTGFIALGGAALAGGALVFGAAAPASAETEVAEPSSFTSAFTVMATPDQVLNADGVATPGPAGASGTFDFRVNSELDIICYDITVSGISGDYMSPAKTATHIHQAAAGKAGPPRIAFPNPAPIGDGPRTSSGCLQGPFTTGVLVDGVDTGTGFTLAQLEADAAAFAADTHTAANPAGAVRGQLTQVPIGGVQTGGGATAASTGAADSMGLMAIAGSLGLAAAGTAVAVGVLRRRRTLTES
ncbi:CHRD domain-containing protein [Herbiconiux liukaitaii]|uniref:CHRD domain-containing protein n=1 Tax=Herbiconiux liukaitaii TaxID=3342799 RepID=UPI0035BB56C7